MQFNSVNSFGLNRYLGNQKQVSKKQDIKLNDRIAASDCPTVYRCESYTSCTPGTVYRC